MRKRLLVLWLLTIQGIAPAADTIAQDATAPAEPEPPAVSEGSAAEPSAGSQTSAKPALEPFTPSEEVSPDTAVSFPVDI